MNEKNKKQTNPIGYEQFKVEWKEDTKISHCRMWQH